jgi:hypothetical protein
MHVVSSDLKYKHDKHTSFSVGELRDCCLRLGRIVGELLITEQSDVGDLGARKAY